ncbi:MULTISPECIES: hypothetical protein [unclassified Alteromonas]|uniref:hypothetical protein n=1 Tax=unclassified Alteromonas TaxID=2614992 RepID=UPI0005099A92|nr:MULTISPECIES: hypothetical protein [unclassified Alteromonas]
MQSRYKQLKEKLPISRLSDDVLLALRVLYDDPLDVVDLKQDIDDLTLYPERLQDSYRKEWETYVLKALAEDLKREEALSANEFIENIMERVEEVEKNDTAYAAYRPMIAQAKSINESGNTLIFPSPFRQQLMAFLLPVSTVE